MAKKEKRKKHSDADRLRYMHMIEDGISINSIHLQYGISKDLLTTLWSKYQKNGSFAISKGKNFKSEPSLKKKIVLDVEYNHITLCTASLKYGPSASIINRWLRIYREKGLDGLAIVKPRGRPPGMGRPKKNSKPLSDLERLEKENQELKTEIALLKKVRALVEARESRLREIGRKSSKN